MQVLAVARKHTDGIVALERHLHLFGERTVQQAAHWVPALPTVLGIAYIALHFLGTTAFLDLAAPDASGALPSGAATR